MEKTDKPDSVPPGMCSLTGVIISLGFELPRTSSDLPEDLGRASRSSAFRRKPADVFLFGLASGDAYRASDVATTAVGSYPTVSPLPDPGLRRAIGGVLSVALSLGLRPVGVTHHLALRSPDFPRRSPPAAVCLARTGTS